MEDRGHDVGGFYRPVGRHGADRIAAAHYSAALDSAAGEVTGEALRPMVAPAGRVHAGRAAELGEVANERGIEQAALIDGCTRLQVIWKVTLPLAIPAMVSVFIYTFMIAWNEFLYALVFLNSRDMFTMPIKVNTIFTDPSPRPHVVMAASTIMTIPVVILFLSMQKFLEKGLTAGGVKG